MLMLAFLIVLKMKEMIINRKARGGFLFISKSIDKNLYFVVHLDPIVPPISL